MLLKLSFHQYIWLKAIGGALKLESISHGSRVRFVLDCILPFKTTEISAWTEGKAQVSSTSSTSYKCCHWALLPGPPSLSSPGDCHSTYACCGRSCLPACKKVQGCYAQCSFNPKIHVERGPVLPMSSIVCGAAGSAPQTPASSCVASHLSWALTQSSFPQTSPQKDELNKSQY